MGEFFHGWRRKIGVVMLAMASLSAAAWLRSFVFFDSVIIAFTENIAVNCISFDGLLYLCAESQTWPSEWSTIPFQEASKAGLETDGESFGVTVGTWYGDVFIAYSYPCIALPLVMLSAYLLLWPGKRPERKTNAPPDSGTADVPAVTSG